MPNIDLSLAVRHYDLVSGLARGRVRAKGITLTTNFPMKRFSSGRCLAKTTGPTGSKPTGARSRRLSSTASNRASRPARFKYRSFFPANSASSLGPKISRQSTAWQERTAIQSSPGRPGGAPGKNVQCITLSEQFDPPPKCERYVASTWRVRG